MHTFNSLDIAKAPTVNIHFQAFPFDIIAVASGSLTTINELATTIDTDMILLTLLLAIIQMSVELHSRRCMKFNLIMQPPNSYPEVA